MSKIARIIVPGVTYHITQRGNARQIVFDDVQDHLVYLKLLRAYTEEYGLELWAWCLMTNHVHLLAVPTTAEALPRALGRTHASYAQYRNARRASCGHVWQARYYSCPLDEGGVWPVMAYIERNPVRAGMVRFAEDYRWSSARAHVTGRDEAAWLEMGPWRTQYTSERWRDALRLGLDEEALQERIRLATRTGRPFGSEAFTDDLERWLERSVRPGVVGRHGETRDLSVQHTLHPG